MTFAEIEELAKASGNDDNAYACYCAELNANDTIYVDKAAPIEEFERLCRDGIAYTAIFNDKPEVAEWFRSIGYAW